MFTIQQTTTISLLNARRRSINVKRLWGRFKLCGRLRKRRKSWTTLCQMCLIGKRYSANSAMQGDIWRKAKWRIPAFGRKWAIMLALGWKNVWDREPVTKMTLISEKKKVEKIMERYKQRKELDEDKGTDDGYLTFEERRGQRSTWDFWWWWRRDRKQRWYHDHIRRERETLSWRRHPLHL